jgi:hypothetical protein
MSRSADLTPVPAMFGQWTGKRGRKRSLHRLSATEVQISIGTSWEFSQSRPAKYPAALTDEQSVR